MEVLKVNRNLLAGTIEEVLSSKKGLETGFKGLDKRINGLQSGDLCVLGGRPAMGKSTLAMNIAYHVAVEEEKKVLYISLDMCKCRWVSRLIRMDCRMDLERLKGQSLNDRQKQEVSASVDHLGQFPLLLKEASRLTVEELAVALKEDAELQDVQLVVIDYLQLLSSNATFGSRQEEISAICRQLKDIAKDCGISILAVSALSRAAEWRPDHRPMLSDLRESGAIEQYADVVLFLYREDYYVDNSENKGIAELIVTKNPYGVNGTEEFVFLEEMLVYKDRATWEFV